MDGLAVVVHAWILGVTVCLWAPADCTDSTLNVLLIFLSTHGAETVRVTWLRNETRLIERVPERLPAPRHKTNLPRGNNDLISPPTKSNAPTSLREKKVENSKMHSVYLQTYPQFFPFISFCNIEALQYIIERKIIKTIKQDCLPQSTLP